MKDIVVMTTEYPLYVASGILYSAGLGVPFVASALLIDKLKSTFDFIKKNYRVINFICGGLLVLVGILMMTGLMGKYLNLVG